MADTITKILFRKGSDSTRRVGGGSGVILGPGEPGFCIDTGRLYIGDGVTSGGRPIGTVNQGALDVIYDDSNPPYYFTETAYRTLTSQGIDAGDLLYDKSISVLYSVSAKNPQDPVPNWNQIVRYDLVGTLSGVNGIAARKALSGNWGPVVAEYQLDPAYFTIKNATCTVEQNFAVSGNSVFGGDGSFYSDVNINGDVTVGGGVSATNSLFTDGVVYANGGSQYNSSVYWSGACSLLFGNSGNWQNAVSYLAAHTPFAWQSPTAGSITYTLDTNGDPSKTLAASINCKPSPSLIGLSVSGATTTATALKVYGGIEATGDVIAYTTSDEKLKTNVSVIQNALDIIDKIDGVEFDWNCEWRSGPDVGVIAQQVEKVFPRVVVDRDNHKAVNYEKLVPLLIQCIKELKSKINE